MAAARDRTSDLPACILALILSLLPLRDALLCGLLSKSWMAAIREMLSTAAALDFGSKLARGLSWASYTNLVDQTLALHQAETLRRLRFFFLYRPREHLGLVDSWLELAAAKRAEVVELDLLVDSPPLQWRLPGTPQCLRSLTWLSLSSISDDPPEYRPPQLDTQKFMFPPINLWSLELPLLQTLLLRRVKFEYGTFGLSDFCPRLSTLILRECTIFIGMKLSSKHLLRLDIIDCWTRVERGIPWVEMIYTPALRSIHIDGYMVGIGFKGLKNVYINTENGLDNVWCNLLSVTTLTLSYAALQDLWKNSQSWPTMYAVSSTFSNLKSLQLFIYDKCYAELLSNFLDFYNFPVLEDLFVEFRSKMVDECHGEQSKLTAVFPSNLRFVCFKGFCGLREQFRMVELFLANAFALDTLVLYATDKNSAPLSGDELAALQRKLEVLPKASKSVKILLGRAGDDLLGLPPAPHAEFQRRYDLPELSRLVHLSW